MTAAKMSKMTSKPIVGVMAVPRPSRTPAVGAKEQLTTQAAEVTRLVSMPAAFEAGKDDHLEEDAHDREDEKRDDGSPDERETVDAQQEGYVRPEGHQVSVREVREASDAVEDRETDRSDNHDAADDQSAHGVLEDDDAEDERKSPNDRDQDEREDRRLDELSTQPSRRAQGRPSRPRAVR